MAITGSTELKTLTRAIELFSVVPIGVTKIPSSPHVHYCISITEVISGALQLIGCAIGGGESKWCAASGGALSARRSLFRGRARTLEVGKPSFAYAHAARFMNVRQALAAYLRAHTGGDTAFDVMPL